MFNLFPPAVFADAGAVVGLLVLIFTVVGWLVNLANSQNNPPAQQQRKRPPRPRGERVRNEIDIFLEEVRGGNAKGDDEIQDADVVLESAPPRQSRRPIKPKPKAPLSAPPEEPKRSRSRLSPHVESHVGETLSQHHLESRMSSEQGVELSPAQAQQQMLTGGPGKAGKKNAPVNFTKLLGNREGIRQAILVNEILSKPKSLRDE